jgi:serine/threonine-protein kinase
MGTPHYVSPEQATAAPLDERTDLYSLGVVLFEMATGRKPFEGETISEVLNQHRQQAPPDPQEINDKIDRDLSALILRCLEKEREHRIPSANELRAALLQIV